MEQHGALISEHGTSKFYVAIFLVPALAFSAVGAFVLYTITLIGKNGLSFHGPVSILYATGFGLIGIAVGAVVACYLLLRTQPTFYLYDRAIRVVGTGIDRTDKYEDIEDLFRYLFILCYRPSADVPWIFADRRRHGYKALSGTFEDFHAQRRGEKLLQTIRSGQSAVFHCLPDDAAWSRAFFRNARNIPNLPLSTIEVTRHHLKIGDKSIPIARLTNVKTNPWTETMTILDVDGHVFHKTHCTAILSVAALYHVLVGLQEEGTLAAAG